MTAYEIAVVVLVVACLLTFILSALAASKRADRVDKEIKK